MCPQEYIIYPLFVLFLLSLEKNTFTNVLMDSYSFASRKAKLYTSRTMKISVSWNEKKIAKEEDRRIVRIIHMNKM